MENKNSKYFKYAIGEIVLVVIGILFALQINNWNENRKETQFETQILKEIESSIQKDLHRNKAILNERILPKKIGIEKLIENLNSIKMEPDSILRGYYGYARIGVIFTFDIGAYESLKSAGLDKIKNDSLRSNLVNFYDNVLPRNKEMININRAVLMQRRLDLDDKIYNYIDFKYSEAWGIKRVLDFEALRINKALREVLELEEGKYFNYFNRISSVIKHSENTLSLITENLTYHD